jgi:hypothetical protein
MPNIEQHYFFVLLLVSEIFMESVGVFPNLMYLILFFLIVSRKFDRFKPNNSRHTIWCSMSPTGNGSIAPI